MLYFVCCPKIINPTIITKLYSAGLLPDIMTIKNNVAGTFYIIYMNDITILRATGNLFVVTVYVNNNIILLYTYMT